MANVEILSLLCAGTTKYHPPLSAGNYTLTGATLTKSEIAGLLAGLDDQETALIFAKYLGDLCSERRLWGYVYQRAAGLAVSFGWKVQRGRPVLANLSYLAVFDVVRPNRCAKCHGTGFVNVRACGRCAGSGVKPLSGRHIAESIGVDESNYRRLWQPRYEVIYDHVCSIESRAVFAIGRNNKNLLSPQNDAIFSHNTE